jgi:predicted oxidoreductase
MRVEEIAEAFSFLHHRGMVRHFGVSNFLPRQWKRLASVCPLPLVCNQIECSLLHLQPLLDGTWDELLGDGLVPLLWSPLAGGGLVDGRDDRTSALLPLLAQIGDQMDLPLAGVALAWLAALPGHPVPVLGTGSCEHLTQAIGAWQQKMDRQDWYALWEAATGQPLP